jgi:DNA polymerase III subunit epsilon
MALRPIYWDLETTGISTKKDRIVEMCFLDPVNNANLTRLINPNCPIPPGATAIHHISDEMVKDAPLFEETIDEIITFCSGEVVLIAHNGNNFDVPFLGEEFKRCAKELPKEWIYVDSLAWARHYRPDLPKHSLQFLREIYELSENNAHRALDDVIMLKKIFELMVDDLSFETIVELLSNPNKITHMPFGKHQGKLLEEVPPSYVKWLNENGALDKPNSESLKEGFVKLGFI